MHPNPAKALPKNAVKSNPAKATKSWPIRLIQGQLSEILPRLDVSLPMRAPGAQSARVYRGGRGWMVLIISALAVILNHALESHFIMPLSAI